MKKILYIIFYWLLTQSTIGQTFTETDLFNSPSNIFYGDDGYYFKDTQSYLNQYTGTWQYNSTGLVIQLRFVKKTFIRNTSGTENFKTDALIGGIRIVKYGQEVLNTLSSVNETKSSDTDYFIHGGPRIRNTANCTLCTVSNQRIYMFYDEPNNDNNHLADMYFLMYVMTGGGTPFLRMEFPKEAVIGDPTQYDPTIENPPTKTSVILPFGSYTFSKIN